MKYKGQRRNNKHKGQARHRPRMPPEVLLCRLWKVSSKLSDHSSAGDQPYWVFSFLPNGSIPEVYMLRHLVLPIFWIPKHDRVDYNGIWLLPKNKEIWTWISRGHGQIMTTKTNHESSSLLHDSFFVYLWIISDLAYITNLVDWISNFLRKWTPPMCYLGTPGYLLMDTLRLPLSDSEPGSLTFSNTYWV